MFESKNQDLGQHYRITDDIKHAFIFFCCPFANFRCDFPPTHFPPDCNFTGGINDLSCLFNLTISFLIPLVQGAGHFIISFLTVFRIRFILIRFRLLFTLFSTKNVILKNNICSAIYRLIIQVH